MLLNEFHEFFNFLGNEARRLALSYFKTPLSIEMKEDASPVTAADQRIEATLRALIEQQYPSHSFLGEEGGGCVSEDYSWVIDPIDGTKSFASGVPLFGTLVALLYNRRPIAGMIEIPALEERWLGNGRDATMNHRVATVSSCRQLKDARLCVTDPRMLVSCGSSFHDALLERVRFARYGMDSYGYALLASGHVDVVVESGLKLHDVMALIPVIEGAGGKVTTWRGDDICVGFDGSIVATASATLHEETIAFLA